MSFLNWLTGHFSNRCKALSLYKRGMARAKKQDHQGAIDDYSATIAMSEAPSEVKAMALYNRALAHVAAGDDRNGVDDLNAVLAMDEALVNVKTMARQKRAKMQSEAAEATGKNTGRNANTRRDPCSF
jgi:hypothetical protein